jgi:hypothetical protein
MRLTAHPFGQYNVLFESSDGFVNLVAGGQYTESVTLWRLALAAGVAGVQVNPTWNVAPFPAAATNNEYTPTLAANSTVVAVAIGPQLVGLSFSDGSLLFSTYTNVNYPTVTITSNLVLAVGNSGGAFAVSLVTNQPAFYISQTAGNLLTFVESTSSACALVGVGDPIVYQCFDTARNGWADVVNVGTGQVSQNSYLIAADDNVVVASSVFDVTVLNASTGAIIRTTTVSPNALPAPVRFGAFIVSFTTRDVWVVNATTGILNTVVDLPLCNGGLPQPDPLSATIRGGGMEMIVAGSAGCVYSLVQQGSNVTASMVGSTATEVLLLPGDTLLMWVNRRGVLTAVNMSTPGSYPVAWVHELSNDQVTFRTAVEYGRFVYAVSSPHSLHVLDKYSGAFVKQVMAANHTMLGPLLAYNNAIWAPTASGVLQIAADPNATQPVLAAILVTGSTQTNQAPLAMHSPPVVSASGILFFLTTQMSVAVNTVTSALLWSMPVANPPLVTDYSAFSRSFAIVDDVLYGDIGSGLATINLRTGATVAALGISSITTLIVSPTGLYFATSLNQIARAVRPSAPATPPPLSTVPAPANPAGQTVAPSAPLPALPPGQQYPSLGCLNRAQVRITAFTNCVSVNVIAAAYSNRTSAGLFDCGAAAPPMAACVADYVRFMAQDCTPGLQYLQSVLTNMRTSAQVPFCGSPQLCSPTAGAQAFCLALALPSFASVMPNQALPAGFTGLPTIPTFTTPPPTTASPPTTTTTTTTTTTMIPTTTTMIPTTTTTTTIIPTPPPPSTTPAPGSSTPAPPVTTPTPSTPPATTPTPGTPTPGHPPPLVRRRAQPRHRPRHPPPARRPPGHRHPLLQRRPQPRHGRRRRQCPCRAFRSTSSSRSRRRQWYRRKRSSRRC